MEETGELDELKAKFERALERWIRSIQRLEEVLAETSHSARSEDIWKEADFEQEAAQKAANEARKEYEDCVRKANFGF